MNGIQRHTAWAAVQPWIMWLIGAVFYFYTFFQRTAPSAMVPELMADLNVSAGALGQLSAYYFYAYAAMQIPTGILADYWGPRRLLLGAAGLSGVGCLLFATAEGLTMASLGRLMIGAGAGFGFISTLKVITEWFPPGRLAMLSGMTMLLGMAGGVAGQAPLAAGVALVGWRPIMMGAAIVALLGCAVVVIIFRNRPPKLDDRGYESATAGSGRRLGLMSTARNPQTWVFIGFGATIPAGMHAFGGLWGVPYMMQVYGMSRPDAAFSASLILIGWGLAAPVVGWLSDRLGRRKPVLIACAALAGATLGTLIYVAPLAPLTVKCLMFAHGVSVAGMVVCFAGVREQNRPEDAGVAIAYVNMAVILCGAILQPLVGALLDLGWQGHLFEGARLYSLAAYRHAFLVFPAALAMAFLFACLIREAPRPARA